MDSRTWDYALQEAHPLSSKSSIYRHRLILSSIVPLIFVEEDKSSLFFNKSDSTSSYVHHTIHSNIKTLTESNSLQVNRE